MKYILHIIILVVTATSLRCNAQDSIQVLTLNDCIRMGLENSTQIIRSKDSIRLSGAELLGAYGQFLPNLNLNATDNYTHGKQLLTIEQPTVVSSKVNEFNYQLSSSFNIFNGFNDYAALKASILNKKAAQYNFQRAKQAIAFDITQTYLQMVLDSHVVNFAITNLDASVKRQDQLAEETRVGRTSISDLYQQEAQTSQDKLYLIQSQNKLKNDRILLLTKLRITQTDKYVFIDEPIDTVPLTSDYENQQQVINEANDNRSDLKAEDLQVKMASWRIRQSQSGYYPKLNLLYGLYSYGGYFYQLSINGEPQPLSQQPPPQAYFGQIYGGVQLMLTWAIFDRFATRTAVEESRVYRDLAQLDRDDLAISISADIKRAYNDYTSALQQLETANKGLVSTNSSFNVLQDRYNVGNASFIELSNSQVTYFQAQISKEQAAIDMMLQKITINYYVGK